MAEKSARTKKRGDGHTKGHTKHEMNRNREVSFGGALTMRRQGPSDAPGKSSSRARSRTSGTDRQESVMAPRSGSGTSGGTARSRDARPNVAATPGLGIDPPRKGRKRGGAVTRKTRPLERNAKGRVGTRDRSTARQKRG